MTVAQAPGMGGGSESKLRSFDSCVPLLEVAAKEVQLEAHFGGPPVSTHSCFVSLTWR